MGTKTLLNMVNDVLTKNSVIDSNNYTLTSLTDSARQLYIDNAVQVVNEVIEELYHTSRTQMPSQIAEATITLSTNDRDYALASDLIELYFPLLDETNGRYILEYPDGYENLVIDQLQPGNYTGLPIAGVVSPVNGELYLDRIPTAAENGLVYKYRYKKELIFDEAADTFPFTDAVYRALVPCASELWKREANREFDGEYYRRSLGRAARMLKQVIPRDSWNPVKIKHHEGLPFGD